MTFAATLKKALPLLALAGLLSACNGFFDKDNTPTPKALVSFNASLNPQLAWSTQAGSGADGDTLKMTPALTNNTLYTTSANGTITAIALDSGDKRWQTNTKLALTTGPASNDTLVVAGSRHGDVVALNASNGTPRWQVSVKGELLANPAINTDTVIVKTIDGNVIALDTRDGHTRWTMQQTEPNLILRASSAPVIQADSVIAGFANGNLTKISLASGNLLWMQPIATPDGIFPIQRMIDIDATPVVFHQRVFAATYQGNIASLSQSTGQILWSHDISTYTGMDVDDSAAFVTDARGYVYAFDANSGLINWRQTDLDARVVTAPAIMNSTIVVGDAEGYLHWMDRQDGHFVARAYAGSPLYATPLVQNNTLYALTTNGKVLAYRLTAP